MKNTKVNYCKELFMRLINRKVSDDRPLFPLYTTRLLVIILLNFTIQNFAQNKYDLTYKYEKGKTYLYRSVLEIETEKNSNGREENSKTTLKTKMRMKAENVSSDKFDTVVSFDSIYSKTSYNTGREDLEDTGEGFTGIRNKITYSNLGHMIQNIEIDSPQTKDGIKLFTGGTAIIMPLSGKPMGLGDLWSVTTVDTTKLGANQRMVVKSELECRIKGIERRDDADCLRISFNGNKKYDGVSNSGDTKIVTEGKGKVSGFFFFDIGKSVVTGLESSEDVTLITSVPERNYYSQTRRTVKINEALKDK